MNVQNQINTVLAEFGLPEQEVASENWWKLLRKIGAPYIKPQDRQLSRVLFIWQDPSGNEQQSPVAGVLLDANSLTDHHSWEPTCLHRVANTDLWFTVLTVNSQWRGSYAFIAMTYDQLPQRVKQREGTSREAQRKWWMEIAPNQVPDPLNLSPSYQAGWGKSSPLHLHNAPIEYGWEEWEMGLLPVIDRQQILDIDWHSWMLKNHRQCCFYSTTSCVESSSPLQSAPLVVLLDGQKWGEESGLLAVLNELTKQQCIAPAHYLLIPVIDGETRYKELSCNSLFCEALINELLPLLKNKTDYQFSQYLIAGQSLGGLTALYAGLLFPDIFTKVISLSGSFWWPEESRVRDKTRQLSTAPAQGSVCEKLLSGEFSAAHLQVFQTVGYGEQDMIADNLMTCSAIQTSGGAVEFNKVHGGHDWLSWRGSLINGLMHLLPG